MPNDSQLEALKVPPHSMEAEQSVLGGLLLDNAAVDRVADIVGGDDFYSDAHRLLYRRSWSSSPTTSRPTSSPSAKRSARSRSSTTSAAWRISARWSRTCRPRPTSAATPRSCASARSCADSPPWAARSPTARINPLGRSVREILDQAETKVFEIAEHGARGQQGFQEIRPLLTQVVERIEFLYNRDNPSDVTGIATGFTDLDRMTSGLPGGRPDRHRGTAQHGQDRARAQHRRAHRARARRCRWRCSAWKWARRSSPCA